MEKLESAAAGTTYASTQPRYQGLLTLRWALPLGAAIVGAAIITSFYVVPPFRALSPELFIFRVVIFIVAFPFVVFLLANWGTNQWVRLLATETQARRFEEQFRRLIERVNDGYLVIQERRVVFANRRMAEIFGYSREELMGKDHLEFVPARLREEANKLYDAVISGERSAIVVEPANFLTKDGTEGYGRMSASLVEYGGSPAFAMLFADITEQVAARHELELRNRELTAVNQFSVQALNERAKAIEALEDNRRLAGGLFTVAHRLIKEQPQRSLAVDIALDEAIRAVGGDAGELWLWEEGDNSLRLYAVRGFSAAVFKERTRFSPGEGLPGAAFRSGVPTVSTNISQDPRFLRPAVKAAGYASYIGIPIPKGNAVLGVVGIAYLKQRDFGTEELQYIDTFAHILGLALVPEG